MKSRLKGFTLVELIVVIAIIGVLAAILVPSMMGYVKKSKYTTANANAKEIYVSLTTYAMQLGQPTGAPNGVVSKQYLRDTYNTMPDAAKANMSADLEGYFGVVFDSEGYPKKAAWAKSDNATEAVGRYPDPTSVDEPANWSDWNI